jgi:hypothetical protein
VRNVLPGHSHSQSFRIAKALDDSGPGQIHFASELGQGKALVAALCVDALGGFHDFGVTGLFGSCHGRYTSLQRMDCYFLQGCYIELVKRKKPVLFHLRNAEHTCEKIHSELQG